MDANTRIKQAIREAMKKQRITQNELAKKLGVKQPHIAQRLSPGAAKVPKSLLDVLDALGLELVVKECK